MPEFKAPERLKSALKEKEQKIEQLMKERQLERAEIAKASIQTEEAESQLVNIKREFISHKGQSQEQLKNLQEALQVRQSHQIMNKFKINFGVEIVH